MKVVKLKMHLDKSSTEIFDYLLIMSSENSSKLLCLEVFCAFDFNWFEVITWKIFTTLRCWLCLRPKRFWWIISQLLERKSSVGAINSNMVLCLKGNMNGDEKKKSFNCCFYESSVPRYHLLMLWQIPSDFF